MFSKDSKSLFLLVFITLSIRMCRSSELVPVFMWDTQNTVEPSPALHRTSEKEFKEMLSERLTTDPLVVVFAEETLSPEDFAQHNKNGKTPFKALQKLSASTNVGYKPYVNNPIGAIKQLEKGVTEISIASLLRNFKVPKDEVLIVDLNDAKDDEEREDLLRRHDNAISQVFEKLLENTDNILAIYTSHHTSWVTPEEVKHRNARSLLQQNESTEKPTKELLEQKKPQQVDSASENTPIKDVASQNGYTITDNSMVLLHVLSSPIYSSDDGKTYENLTLGTQSCDRGDQIINLELTDKDKGITCKFIFTFQKSGYWILSNVTSGEAQFSVPDITAPVGFSYHCFNATFKFKDQILTLPGIQIQPFPTDAENHVFGDPYNCVGFTSIPIWSGILITVVLLLILTFGITLMMDIRTMDKFDDAKGKSITINAAE